MDPTFIHSHRPIIDVTLPFLVCPTKDVTLPFLLNVHLRSFSGLVNSTAYYSLRLQDYTLLVGHEF